MVTIVPTGAAPTSAAPEPETDSPAPGALGPHFSPERNRRVTRRKETGPSILEEKPYAGAASPRWLTERSSKIGARAGSRDCICESRRQDSPFSTPIPISA